MPDCGGGSIVGVCHLMCSASPPGRSYQGKTKITRTSPPLGGVPTPCTDGHLVCLPLASPTTRGRTRSATDGGLLAWLVIVDKCDVNYMALRDQRHCLFHSVTITTLPCDSCASKLHVRPQGEPAQRPLEWSTPCCIRRRLCRTCPLPQNRLLFAPSVQTMAQPKLQLRHKVFEKRVIVSR